MPATAPWDLFCRVIDNYGDIGVCWRLAADLAARGQPVRLWIDDASGLAWMAPGGAVGVTVVPWTGSPPALEPGEVVIEAFGCNPPADFVARMAQRQPPPLWINLEYLSAQAYVARSHGLPSPQLAGPGRGLIKWFFYPGFVAESGGLIRERGLSEARATFDAPAWLRARGLVPRPHERIVSLFCYPQAPLAELLRSLSHSPTLLLLTPGPAQAAARSLPTPSQLLRCVELSWLTQADYDRLLWACALNFVRGEDSLVRALWAGSPFVWQIYPQHDGVHAHKLQSFLDLFLRGAEPTLAADLRALWSAWNGLAAWPLRWPNAGAWSAQAGAFRAALLAQPDLGSELLRFVAERR